MELSLLDTGKVQGLQALTVQEKILAVSEEQTSRQEEEGPFATSGRRIFW